jgi:hypothetical protein
MNKLLRSKLLRQHSTQTDQSKLGEAQHSTAIDACSQDVTTPAANVADKASSAKTGAAGGIAVTQHQKQHQQELDQQQTKYKPHSAAAAASKPHTLQRPQVPDKEGSRPVQLVAGSKRARQEAPLLGQPQRSQAQEQQQWHAVKPKKEEQGREEKAARQQVQQQQQPQKAKRAGEPERKSTAVRAAALELASAGGSNPNSDSTKAAPQQHAAHGDLHNQHQETAM